MATLILGDGLHLNYQIDGAADAPALLFSNSLGTDLHLWDGQVAALGSRYRIVRYDTRGHGQSGVLREAATLDQLGHDLAALLDHLRLERVHLCGLSLGGMAAQWLAIHHPERVDRLVLSNSAARIGSVDTWAERIAAVERGGVGAVAAASLGRFFSPAFHGQQPQVVAQYDAMLRSIDPAGYTACCAALRDADLRGQVAAISAPTLVIGGSLDQSTPPEQARELANLIRTSELAILDGAAHLANVEQPDAFNSLLAHFLAKGGPDA